ncbi:MAG TPA: SpoIIE family protein phosphatase [Acetobacteraceae bacterium]|nr:SpoIIE family protein phosphatase [Acetobacteraceae bacterium]
MADADEDFTERTLTFRASMMPRAVADTSAHLLLVHVDNAPPRHVALNLLPLTVGRSAPADVVLAGSTVSRRHCRIARQGESIVVEDLGSTNGTFVNSERISAPSVLEDGARIMIGEHALTYHRRSRQELEGWEALDRELGEASDYVLSVLPPPITTGPVQAEWYYQPCTRLGGDAFGYQMLDTRHFAAYMLDVAGHGAGSALFAVTVANVLRQRMLPDVDFRDPGVVIRGLNRMFPMERHNNLFFTMWYGVYDMAERALTFATAGHHPAYLLTSGAAEPAPLGTRNPSIGIGADRAVATARAAVPADSTLALFSDGVFEITDADGRDWDLSQVLSLLPVMALPKGPLRLHDKVRMAARSGPLEDDFSALAVRFI